MWVAVYVAMNVVQGGFRWEMGPLGPGVILSPIADEFGSLTAREVATGQVWRTITATFVHLSLIHLACNLSCLIACGRLLNSWYGGPQFFCLYLAIAAVGNGLAVAGRYLLRGGLDTPCAGGSSVMFGFIALIAVVGWRSKTRFGDYVRREMVTKLFFFGVVIGIVGRNVLDNYGHAGGAIAGALAGFLHRPLVRWYDRRIARVVAFVAAAGIVVACVAGGAGEGGPGGVPSFPVGGASTSRRSCSRKWSSGSTIFTSATCRWRPLSSGPPDPSARIQRFPFASR